MIAVVLSGAGARGPLHVGALQALLEAGLEPEFLVGTSSGAINAAYLAARGLSAESVATMSELWKRADGNVVYPGGLWGAAWRLVRKSPSLFPNAGMRRLIREGLPQEVTTFRDLQLPLYVTAVDLLSRRLFLFGEDPRAPVVDAVLASASIPVIHPPVAYHGLQLVDGGVLANAAASVAMEKGATQVYVLNAGYAGEQAAAPQNLIDVANETLTTMMAQSLLADLAFATREAAIDLHHIVLRPSQPVAFGDFSQVEMLVQRGYDAAKAYLAAPRPHAPARRAAPRADLGEVAPGVRELLPPYRLEE